jgi:hypothetical protein
LARGGDPWRGLGWQFKVELADQELLIGVQLVGWVEFFAKPIMRLMRPRIAA